MQRPYKQEVSMKKSMWSAVVVAFLLPTTVMADATPPAATTASYDLSEVPSWNAAGNAANVVLSYNIGAGSTLTSVGWNVFIEAFTPSWRQDIGLQFSDSAVSASAVWLNPGAGVASAGTGTYSSAPVDLGTAGLAFAVLADGILRLEFFESFDDGPTFQDGVWHSGSVTIGYTMVGGAAGTLTLNIGAVPEPGTYGLMALGMLGVLLAARRRAA
jgi:hypothetical protein